MGNETKSSVVEHLEERVAHLEDQARFTLDALELAASLGDFQVSISSLHEPTALLGEAVARIARIARFSASAFYLVDEGSSDFYLAYSDKPDWSESIEAAITSFIDSGMFAFALTEGRPVIVHSVELKTRIVLHVLETSSRVRGMFMGVFPDEARNLTAIEMALLSIVCKNCASAVEVFELYKCFKCGGEDVLTFADSLPAGMIDIGREGRLLFANKAAGEIMGGQCSPQKCYFMEYLVPEERERVASLLVSCFAYGHSTHGNSNDEYKTETIAKPAAAMRAQTILETARGMKSVTLHLTPMLRNGETVLRGIIAPVDDAQEQATVDARTANT